MNYKEAFETLKSYVNAKLALRRRGKDQCTNPYEYAEKVGGIDALLDMAVYIDFMQKRIIKEKNECE